MQNIDSFQGEHRFLSNFWPANVNLDGVTYPSVEHAYQAAKTIRPTERARIFHAPTPGYAKRAGRGITMRADWESVKLGVMEDLVTQKFKNNADLAARLMGTGNAELIEGNTWGDRYWGVCRGTGENHLGKILMRVREALHKTAAK